MNLSAPFIHRPIMTILVMAIVLIFGGLAFHQLPVSDLPTIEHPEIEIRTGYVGASPETVLKSVTVPLEKELSLVKGTQEMISSSRAGYSIISLKFDLNKEMDQAIRDVQAAINRAEPHMPHDLDPRPYYRRQQESQDPMMYLVLTSPSMNISDIRSYADAHLIPRLSRLEGVAQVAAFGEKKSIWIKLNPEWMAARRIGFDQVINAISESASRIPMGSIKTGTKLLAIEMAGDFSTLAQLENLEVGHTHVRLKDIAEISEKASEDVNFNYLANEKKTTALILGIQKISDANTVAISQNVRQTIEQTRKLLPASILINIWFDKAVWIQESIFDVEWTLIFAFALVVVVIYLSLGRLSEALIPSVALPLSLVGTFGAMYLANFSLDILSLLALTLSVGFVVDDAIVVLENIVRHQEKGSNAYQASLKGSRQISFTILSMTLSLVTVFIPLLFMPGMIGRLFQEFSITLAIAILISGIISLSLTPMLCSRFLPEKAAPTKMQERINFLNNSMTALYAKSLQKSFLYPKTVLLAALALIAVTIPLFLKLPVELAPPEDRGFFFSFVSLPNGSSDEEIAIFQTNLENIFQQDPAVESLLDIYYSGNLVFAVRLKPQSERISQKSVIASIQKKLDEIPGILASIQPYYLINLNLEFGSSGNFKYVLKGQTFEDVQIAAQKLAQSLQEDPRFGFVQPPQKNDYPKLVININEDKAKQMGLSKKHLQGLLQHAYGQGEVATLKGKSGDKKVFIELLNEYQNTPEALSKLYLSPMFGDFIPLKAVANWNEELGSPFLVHREQQPSSVVRFSLSENTSAKEGFAAVETLAANVLPDNVQGEFSGLATTVASTTRNTLLLLFAAAVVMYLVLGILYESFIHPLTILSSLPFAGLGGVLTLFLFNEPLSIFSGVGFLLLIGIVKKNGIMMVDYALENQKQGMSARQAIYEGCLVRFRPIMMTTMAAMMGAIPIAIGFGDGAEMRRGLGLVIVGGLLFSQLLTLYVTPILYLAFEKLCPSKQKPLPFQRSQANNIATVL